jgi:hypothetical protein
VWRHSAAPALSAQEESEQRHIDRLATRMLNQHGSAAAEVAEMRAWRPRGSETWSKGQKLSGY